MVLNSGYDLKIVCLSTCTACVWHKLVHCCYTVLTSRKKKKKTAKQLSTVAFKLSVWSLSCHCCVTFSTQLSETMAARVNYKCKSFVKLAPGFTIFLPVTKYFQQFIKYLRLLFVKPSNKGFNIRLNFSPDFF